MLKCVQLNYDFYKKYAELALFIYDFNWDIFIMSLERVWDFNLWYDKHKTSSQILPLADD